ncbi:MAG: pyridoxal 5'-phosphate synthase glutaminase subunit PdxT [Odoribacter sp.]
MKIGILGFQGAVIEHQRHIERIGCEAIVVKYPEQLDDLDGIILPGGESTTIGKLLNRTGMMEPLRLKIQKGLPVWGTCAGMILLAKELVNDSVTHLATMDISVKRNAYGTQIDSFDISVQIPEISQEEIPLVFIRAPYIANVGDKVNVLCRVKEHIVAAREKNMLVTSFHPELTDNSAFHRYFAAMCKR